MIDLLDSALRMSTPLLWAALAGLLCERSGLVNIALEGWMLVGAFFAALAATFFHSAWMGALGGAAGGVVIAAFWGVFVLRFRAQPIVAGMAVNILAAGLTPFLCNVFFGATGSSPSLPIESRFTRVPLIGAWAAALVVWAWLKWSVSGLRLQFAGENPEALKAAGVSVARVRWGAVLGAGVLAGLGGASLSIFLSSSFSRNMTSGRGYIALAALILGRWTPWPVAFSCLFFGLAEALEIRLQGSVAAPVQLLQILPYVITLLALAGFMGRSRSPTALGEKL